MKHDDQRSLAGSKDADPDNDWIQQAIKDHEGSLLRYALSFVSEIETARDIVQETFLSLCRQQYDDLRPKLAQWLFTVCRNRAIDFQRKESHMRPSNNFVIGDQPDASASPESSLVRDETAANLWQQVATLTDRQQEVLRLKFSGGLSYREIAGVTGLTVSNVGVTLHTAITKLKTNMTGS